MGSEMCIRDRSWVNYSNQTTAELDAISGVSGAPAVSGRGTVFYALDGSPAINLGTQGGVVADTAAGRGSGAPAYIPAGNRVGIQLSMVDEVMQNIYEEGGKATKIMVSPKLRRDFSAQAQAAGNVRRNIDEKGSLRQSVDMYMSDFGELMVVPNYIMGLGAQANYSAFIYDPMWFAIATLRPMQEVDVGQRGDSTVGMIVEECTLECKNPFGSGAIYGLA